MIERINPTHYSSELSFYKFQTSKVNSLSECDERGTCVASHGSELKNLEAEGDSINLLPMVIPEG